MEKKHNIHGLEREEGDELLGCLGRNFVKSFNWLGSVWKFIRAIRSFHIGVYFAINWEFFNGLYEENTGLRMAAAIF